jgi:predicted kinase
VVDPLAMIEPASLVLLVGPPAAGKSTLAAALVAAGVVAPDDVLSTDRYRELITGDATDTGQDRQMWVRLRADLVERMAAGRTTVVDATNVYPRRRARHVRVAHEHGRPVLAICFDVPLPDLLARNRVRDRVVRPAAIIGMAEQMASLDAEVLLAEGIGVVLDADGVRQSIGMLP